MALFDRASLVQIPSGYKEGKLYNIKPFDQPFEFERGSAATRVNEDGLIEYVGKGAELVTNGDFSDDSSFPSNGWTISSGSPVISNGKLTLPNNARVRQIDVVETTEEYVGSIEISGLTQGYVDFYIGNVEKVSFDSNGTFSFFVSDPTSTIIYLYAFDNFDGEIDNVSVKKVSNDTPRIDYTNGKSLLLEPQRTNLVTDSNDFTTSGGWSLDSATISLNNTISPDGNLTASLCKGDTDTSRHNVKKVTLTGSVSATCSVFVKAKELRYIQIASANTGLQYANFDVKDGVVGTVGSDFSNAKIEDYGNGWYRCSAVSTNQYNGFWISLVSGLNAGWLESWSMPNNTDGLYIYGAQVEQGSYATSYIPTNGQTETRLADVCQGGGDESTFNDSEGTLYGEFDVVQSGITNGLMFVSDGSFSNHIMLRFNPTHKFQIEGTGGVNVLDTTTRSNGKYKVAITYGSKSALFVNGTKVLEESDVFSGTGLNECGIGTSPYGNGEYNTCHIFAYFPEVLTDSELQTLTTI